MNPLTKFLINNWKISAITSSFPSPFAGALHCNCFRVWSLNLLWNRSWNQICRDDDEEEGAGLERELKRRLKKRYKNRAASEVVKRKKIIKKYTKAAENRQTSGSGLYSSSQVASSEQASGIFNSGPSTAPSTMADAALLASFRPMKSNLSPQASLARQASARSARRHSTLGQQHFAQALRRVETMRQTASQTILRRASSGSEAHHDEFHVKKIVKRCPLGVEATREARIAWLTETGRKLRNRGFLECSPARWNENVQQEKDALDKVGFLFDAYKIEFWYYELVSSSPMFPAGACKCQAMHSVCQ